MDPALTELVHQPCIDRAEEQLTALGAFTRTLDVLQNPAQLCRGKVGVDDQACFLTKTVGQALFDKLIGVFGGTAALPHDRVTDRLTRRLIPHDGGLTLVGDADRGDLIIGRADLAHRLTRDAQLRLPDLVRVVLDPSGLRKKLGEFLLRY